MANQQTLEILLRIKAENDAALKRFESDMKGVREETQRTGSALGGLSGASKGFSDALTGSVNPALLSTQAAGFAAGAALVGLASAVVAGVKEFAAFGSQITDSAAKLSIGVVAFQKFEKAGELVGVTAQDVGGAITQMKNRLNDAPAGFEKLGLSVEKLKRMKPEEAFEEVASALAKIPNAADQTTAAMDVLGRGGIAVLPLIKSGFQDAGDEAERLGQILDEETVAAADALDDQMTVLNSTWDGFIRNMAAAIGSNPDLVKGLSDITELLGSMSKALQDNNSALSQTVTWIGRIASAVNGVMPTLRLFSDLMGGDPGSPRVKTGGISFEPPGGPAAKGAQEMLDLLGKQIEETKELVKVSEDAAKKRIAAIEAENKLREHTAQEWDKFYKTLNQEEYKQTKVVEAEMARRNAAWAKGQIERLAHEKFVRDEMEKAQKEDEEGRKQADEARRARLLQGFDDVAGAISELSGLFDLLGVSADSAFGKALAGMESFSNAASRGAQAFASFASGDILGGIRSGLSALSDLAKGIGSIFGDKEHEKVNDMRDAYVEAAGGITELDKRAQAAGMNVKAFLNAKTVKDYEAAIKQLDIAFKFTEAMGGMDALKKKAAEAGVSLEAMFNAKSAKALEDAIGSIKSELDNWDNTHKKLNAAIEKYGFTLEELGPKFQAQQLDEMAQGLLQDWTLLVASGIDVANVATRMSDSLNDMAAKARATGQSLPENLRPIYEELLRQGKLVDENGNAYGSLEEAGLSFTASLTDSMKELVQEIQRMVAALTGIRVPPIRIGVEYDVSGGPPGGGGGHPPRDEELGFAGGGVGNFGSGTPAMLHGREGILPLDDRRAMAMLGGAIAQAMSAHGGGGSNGTIVVPVSIGNRQFGSVIAATTRRRDARVSRAGIRRF